MTDTTATGSPETTDRQRQASTVGVAEAAHALGISHDALRSRLRRGTLEGFKDGDEWRVVLPADRQPTGNASPQQAATGKPTGNDLAPLVDLIERQAAELQRLTEASTMWSIRARQAEEQLKQLTAGNVDPEPATMDPGSPRTNETMPFVALAAVERIHEGLWDRVRRLWQS